MAVYECATAIEFCLCDKEPCPHPTVTRRWSKPCTVCRRYVANPPTIEFLDSGDELWDHTAEVCVHCPPSTSTDPPSIDSSASQDLDTGRDSAWAPTPTSSPVPMASSPPPNSPSYRPTCMDDHEPCNHFDHAFATSHPSPVGQNDPRSPLYVPAMPPKVPIPRPAKRPHSPEQPRRSARPVKPNRRYL